MENNSDYNQAYIAMVERNEKIIFSVCMGHKTKRCMRRTVDFEGTV